VVQCRDGWSRQRRDRRVVEERPRRGDGELIAGQRHGASERGDCDGPVPSVQSKTITSSRRPFTRGLPVLAEPERTPYDLRFRFLGFPIRVHPFFWLGSVLLGSSVLQVLGAEYLLVWVVVVFVSILVHELGHAIAFRRFGADAEVVLYAFGGLAIPTNTVSGRWRRIGIALAGPVAGFVLAGLVFASNKIAPWAVVVPRDQPWPRNFSPVDYLYESLMFVNVAWGCLNLLPVYPLDGGQVARELCLMKWGTRGTRVSLKISFAVALLAVAYSLLCVIDAQLFRAELTGQLPFWARGTVYTAILFGLLAYGSYQLLQRIEWTDTHWDDKVPWER
jgi:stage IV sporulation protein FB